MGEGILLAVLGLFLGRLINLTIDRLPPGDSDEGSPPGGRQQTLIVVSLVPLVSHLLPSSELRGAKRPARPLAVELITASLCGLIGYQQGLTAEAAVLIFYCALFIHITFVDLKHRLILNKVVLPAIPVAVVLFPLTPLGQSWGIGEAYLRSLSGAGLGFGIMLLIYIASRGGTGAGDVKLAGLLGAILGFPQIAAGLPLGFVLGGVVGIFALIFRLKGRKEAIPFGPALVLGTILVLLGGTGVYTWYLDLFR